MVSEDSEKLNPQIYLTKSMLRSSYIGSNSNKKTNKERNLELERPVSGDVGFGFVNLRKEALDEPPRFKDFGMCWSSLT